MMKTISVLMAAWILSSGIWCQAAESENITEDPLQSDVYARSRYSKAWIEVPVSQGEAVAALPDGTLIKAENAPEHAAVFKVILIDPSERDAWAWIKSCLDERAEPHQAYDLSFEDDEGERISIDQAMISIADDDALESSVYSLGIEGDAAKLESYSAHETICFRGNDHRYYAVILGALSDLPEDIGSPPTSVQHESVLLLLLIVSGTMSVMLIRKKA